MARRMSRVIPQYHHFVTAEGLVDTFIIQSEVEAGGEARKLSDQFQCKAYVHRIVIERGKPVLIELFAFSKGDRILKESIDGTLQ